MPVPGARAALLLLGQGQKLEAGEERGQGGQVAIVVWVRLGVAAADEGIGGDRPAAAELRIALRQHSPEGRIERLPHRCTVSWKVGLIQQATEQRRPALLGQLSEDGGGKQARKRRKPGCT